ncbi:hydrogen gas-evolving membrane-bound hydrogenase subunit E [Clostridium sp.]|uniref:hydrogen gas-evolving membrane-bound hydrogenase subunit E n=1 Tax=Clostridium sp. TaxID=1506 RepID=UPI002FC971F7
MKKFIKVISLFIIAISFLIASYTMSKMPSTYDGIGEEIVNNTVEKTGAINTVTATVFDFRGYDTLGESFVLFTAICGITVVLRKSKKGDLDEEE